MDLAAGWSPYSDHTVVIVAEASAFLETDPREHLDFDNITDLDTHPITMPAFVTIGQELVRRHDLQSACASGHK